MANYKMEEVDELRNIQRGDQIGVSCSISKVSYCHFGIYLGPNEGVAEFGIDFLRKVDLFKFKGDSKLFRAVYQKDQCLSSEAVAQKAEDFVKNPQSYGNYSHSANNSEHFATYCKTGLKVLTQSERENLDYTMEEVDELRNLQRGDQIGVLRPNNNFAYVHFGIYLGPNEGVAEFGNNYLRIVDLFKFKGDSKLFRAVYQKEQCLIFEEVAKRAENFMKNPQSYGTYDQFKNNNEHFATYCKTGTAFKKSKRQENQILLGKEVDYKMETFELRNIQRGDQIGVLRSINKVKYFHFGIYIGPSEGVAEFGDAGLRKIKLSEFKGDSKTTKYFRAVYQSDECLASEDVVKKAEDLVKNHENWETYSLFTKNSEHFATYCKTGKAYSNQVVDNLLLGKSAFP